MKAQALGDPQGIRQLGVRHDAPRTPPRRNRQARSIPRTLVARRTANSFKTSSPTSWPKVSLMRLKWSMSTRSADTGSAALRRALHQGADLGGHVAAIVQSRQRVGDRQLQAVIEGVAQNVRVALLANQGLDPRRQLLRIDRAVQDVVDAELQRLGRAASVVGFDDGQDRHMAGGFLRPHLGGQAQAVEPLAGGVDDQKIGAGAARPAALFSGSASATGRWSMASSLTIRCA